MRIILKREGDSGFYIGGWIEIYNVYGKVQVGFILEYVGGQDFGKRDLGVVQYIFFICDGVFFVYFDFGNFEDYWLGVLYNVFSLGFVGVFLLLVWDTDSEIKIREVICVFYYVTFGVCDMNII